MEYYKEDNINCVHCGESNNYPLCQECEKTHDICDICNFVVPNDQIVNHNDNNVCISCVNQYGDK